MAKRRSLSLRGCTSPIGIIAIITIAICVFAMVGILGDEDGGSTKEHVCVSDAIDATVGTDGSLHVVEARTYEFTGRYTLSAIVLDPRDGGSVTVNGVSVIDEDGVETPLARVDFDTRWRTVGGAGDGHYSFDAEENTVYAFSDTTDETKTFVFDYTYTNEVQRYADTSVLYRQFVPANWDTDSNDVTITVHLPVAEGDAVTAGDNVRAYGHGPLDGDVSIDESAGDVVFTIPYVESGEFAEARIAFPREWTPNVAAEATFDSDYLPGMLQEEQEWADEANHQRMVDRLLVFVPLVASAVMTLLSVVLFLRHGREHRPQQHLDYWRDVPEKGIHPAVIARLMSWNREDANDITATLMHMSNRGVISVEPATYKKSQSEQGLLGKAIHGDKDWDTYALVVRDKSRLKGMSEIDRDAFRLVFKVVGKGADRVTMHDIEHFALHRSEDYVAAINQWQRIVSGEVGKQDFFEPQGAKIQDRLRVASILVGFGTFFFSCAIVNFAPFLGSLPGVVVMLVFAQFMPRRSVRGVEVKQRADALERWLRDFTNLREAVPTDGRVWGDLLVYAYLFGISERVCRDLDRVAPQVWEDDQLYGARYWYWHPHVAGGPAQPASSSGYFGTVFSNTVSTAHNAIAASDSSSSGGGGGGFSGGGGGGAGGGGGGFSR